MAEDSRVGSALRALDLLSRSDGWSVRSLAEALGLSRSASHRILVELENAGYAVRRASGRGYGAGPALLTLRRIPAMTPAERFRLRPVLQDLREETGESVHSAVLAGDHVLVLDGRRSVHARDIGLRVGMTAPAHAMAAGKLLLAALPDAAVAALVATDPLPRRAARTIVRRADLLRALAEVRPRGWADAQQESEPHVSSIAVPFDGTSASTRIALVVSVPAERGSPARLDELAATSLEVVARHAATGRVRPWTV